MDTVDTPLCTIPTQNRFACLPVYDTVETDDTTPSPPPVFTQRTTEEAPSLKKRGRRESVLNSSLKNHKKTEKPPSAAEPKPFNAISINSIGPKLFNVVRAVGAKRQMDIPLTLENPETTRKHSVQALLDTGCTGSCIHRDLVRRAGLTPKPYERPIPVHNADGTPNVGGHITHYVEVFITVGNHREKMQLLVTDLGKADLFLGHEWIQHHNPVIDWQKKTLEFERCPHSCEMVLDEGDRIFMLKVPEYLHARRASVAMDIAIEQHKMRKPKTFEETVPEHYHDYRDVFEDSAFETLPERRPYDHAIELLPDAKPYCGKIYPMPRAHQEALDEFLDENLRTGRIRPSKSPWGAPFFFVKKKDGKLRPVQDYRKLNAMTKKNKYPLPLMSELFDKLKGAKYYTKLDVRWGYNNIRMKHGDEEKAAFITNRGLFEPTVMFFGLSNSPSTFQTMMNDIFKDLILQGHVIIYLDDILILSQDLKEHRSIVRKVLQILRDNKLTCKPDKCEFEVQETEYLGHIIAPGIVKMDPAKVEGVTKWPTPTCKKHVQGFLGFANFYRRFIKDFSKVAGPLNRLTGLNEWRWTSEEQTAFDTIKTLITTAPVLAVPDDEGQFKVECDASKFALGAELSQKQEGKWRTIAFLSRSLTPAERNYEIYDREMLAIIHALDEWRHFLLGAKHPVEVRTDHKNLEYFRKPQRLNPRQARWLLTIQEYDLALAHHPGKSMGKPDALSRRPDHADGITDDEESVMLKPHMFRAVDGTSNLLEEIKENMSLMDLAIMEQLGKSSDLSQAEDGLIYRRGKLVVPNNEKLRGRIISSHHDSITAGHPGRDRTQELIYRSYWWPSLRKDVARYIKGCVTCQRTKIRTQRNAAPLNPHDVPSRNWENISVDLITDLPSCLGFDAILVIVDMKSKDVIAIPCNKTLDSEGYANLLLKHVYVNHGLPLKITSDRGPQFVSNFTRDLYKKLGIKGNPSTAYHPQTDGQTERMNREIKNYLRIFINYRQDDWVDWLPLAVFSYRNKRQESTKLSPFFMNHGFHPYTGVETKKTAKTESVEQFVERMKEISDYATESLQRAKELMKKRYDQHQQPSREYQPNDLVWLEATHISTDRPRKKLEHKRYGPFKIVSKIGAGAYKLKLPKSLGAIHPVFHEDLLTPAHAPEFANQEKLESTAPQGTEQPPEPETILDVKEEGGTLHYLVHWVGQPWSERTWVSRGQLLSKYKHLLDDFHKRSPAAKQPIPPIRIAPRARLVTLSDPHDKEWDFW